jgi:L-amino acid N-acyltransferase YncA
VARRRRSRRHVAVSRSIRLATFLDADAVSAIYAPFCESSAVSFEESAPSTAEMAQRIEKIAGSLPWLVLDEDGRVGGYAYATSHRERAAYRWSVDSSVYVDAEFRGRGTGRALYTALFDLLRLQGYFRVHAGITLPNDASVGIHTGFGFQLVGIYPAVGYKHGSWHDVAWYQLMLRQPAAAPAEPRRIDALVDSPEWTAVVTSAVQLYQGSFRSGP